ncbi:MAG: hypothetical protein DWQ06_16595 [Calditrichaeota bacterium]|nr:MAG: hypothetical protein DWQ06_16595 [Calditrichota bacterium]
MDCIKFKNTETWFVATYLDKINSFDFHQNKPKNELIEELKKSIQSRIPRFQDTDLWSDLIISALDNVKWDLIINHFLSEVENVRESS